VTEVGREFAAAEEVKTFVRANRNGKIADSTFPPHSSPTRRPRR